MQLSRRLQYCDHALSVCLSLTFHIFDFSSETTERNSTKLDRKQDLNILYQCCGVFFLVDQKNKMAAQPLIGWDIFDFPETTDWNSMKLDRKWSQRSLPSLCFSGQSEKQYGHPDLWLAKTFSTSPQKPLNRIQRNLTGSKISTPSYKFVFFRPIGKTRWPPGPLIGWDIFDFSLDRFVFFWSIRKTRSPQAVDWLRHFRLLLWNHWTEFNETWREARPQPQRPLPILCFSGRSEKQDGRTGFGLAETF